MNPIDFLPERIRHKRLRGRRLVRQGLLLGLCLAGLVVLAYVHQVRIARAETELTLLSGRSANVQRQLSQLGELEAQQAELSLKKRISDHLGSRVNTLNILAELERLMPDSMALTNLEIDTKESADPVAPPESRNASARATAAAASKAEPESDAGPRRLHVTLTGLAPTDVDVATFIGQMAASKLFEEVTMGYAKNVAVRGRVGREFTASCYVVR